VAFWAGAFAGVTFFPSVLFATGREVFVNAVFLTRAFLAMGAEPLVAAFFAAAVLAIPFFAATGAAAPFLLGAFVVAAFLLAGFGVVVLFMPVADLVCGLPEVFWAAVGGEPTLFFELAWATRGLRAEEGAVAGCAVFLDTEDEETAGVSAEGDGATGDEIPGSAAGSGVCSAGGAGESRPFVIGASVCLTGVGGEISASLSRAPGCSSASGRLRSSGVARSVADRSGTSCSSVVMPSSFPAEAGCTVQVPLIKT
jgi:hypothetical protein